MGRLVGPKYRRRQKGVDSLIVRDLIVLARERAICTAYLLAGDEDLRESVATAHEQGLQVILLGIPPSGGDKANQAMTLIREADEHVVLGDEFWSPHLARAQRPDVVRDEPKAEAPAPEPLGAAFAIAWAERSQPKDLQRLLEAAPRIPLELDVELTIRRSAASEPAFGRRFAARPKASGLPSGHRLARHPSEHRLATRV